MTYLVRSMMLFAVVAILSPAVSAQEPAEGDDKKPELPRIEDPKGMRKLVPDSEVWFDAKNKQVVVGGVVCQREALLEMFACPAGSKEHESIIAANAKALIVHTALLAAGAKSGKPAHWIPEEKEYVTATGDRIDVHVEWLDKDGKKQRAKAQDWVRNVRTKEAMTEHWVFGGSGFHVDETTKRKYYLAEGGSLICVSNFPDAMLDVPIESSKSNEELLFAPFTERIPAEGTRVLMYLKPVAEKKEAE
ncbi:MAG: YdjY domain-containing protein [Pirellulales bacterium]|nr:YdjY domain-containing protein [Pirellulales bacterium]